MKVVFDTNIIIDHLKGSLVYGEQKTFQVY